MITGQNPSDTGVKTFALPNVPDRPPAGAGAVPQIPGFDVESPLGRGGMGVVFRATHRELGRPVALKVMRAGLAAGDEDRMRFRAEAEAVAAVSHANIVRVYHVGEYAGSPFLAMEFCPGGTLADRWAAGPADAADAADAVEAVARGVAAAHARGIVHRDLKPENVLIGEEGEVKVADFGLAKNLREGDGLTATGQVMGTPGYMAPEQASDSGRVGPAADVWALGVMLYRGLTGTEPFRGDGPVATLRDVLDREPDRPRSVHRSVPRDLEVICLKCLSKDPAGRYVSADALADDLRRWLDGRSIQARPTGPAEKAWKWAKRNWALAAVSALLAASLIGGAALAAALALRAAAARDDARAERDAKADALAAAERSAARERQARGDTAAYASFLAEDFLAAARQRGKGGLGIDVTVERAVREAEKAIPERFTGRPLAEAMARHELGLTYRNLGDLPASLRNLRRAAELRERHAGPLAAQTVDTLNQLALSLGAAGEDDESAAAAEKALRACVAGLGADHPMAANLRVNLADAYRVTGRIGDAVRLYREALSRPVSTPEGKSRAHHARGGLGRAHLEAGRVADAVRELKLALEQGTRDFGGNNPHVIATRRDLGEACRAAGDLPEAVALLEKALAQSEAVFRDADRSTLYARNELAGAYVLSGRLADAVALFEVNLEAWRKLQPPEGTRRSKARDNLAGAYVKAQRQADAIPLLRQSLEVYGGLDGGDRRAESAAHGLATAYAQSGRWPEAVALFERVVAAREARLGPGHAHTAVSRNNLGRAYLAVGRAADAVAALEKVGTAGNRSVDAETNLAGAYMRLGRFADAARSYKAVTEARSRRDGPAHTLTVTALADLGRAYLAAGEPAKALAPLRRALAGRSKNLGPDHYHTLVAQFNLGAVCMRARRTGEAIKVLGPLLPRVEKLLPRDHPLTVTVRDALAGGYRRSRRYDDAEPLLRAVLKSNRRRFGPADARTADAAVALGTNLVRQDKPAAAKAPLREAVAILRKAAPDSWRAAAASSALGDALVKAGETDEAEKLLTAAEADLAEADAPRKLRAESALRLANLYDLTDRNRLARKWRAAAAELAEAGQPTVKPAK